MSCYQTKRTLAHIKMWGTKYVFGHPDKKMTGHWILVRLPDGREFKGVICGTMGKVRVSRHSKYKIRVLDLAIPGWEKLFGPRRYGLVDVQFKDLGKSEDKSR